MPNALKMICSKCGTEGIPGKKFCAECGSLLSARCSNCSSDNAPGAKFCADCGTPLSAPPASPVSETPPVQARAVAGERRHLTVLFCDLVGSTGIAAQLDPEEWRELVASYHHAAAEAITRYGGHVAKYLGDGVMAYFGWPEAHENDAERAARAGLAILDAISKLNQPSTQPELSARIGIDSGAVVVGASAGENADVFGDTPNIAARVQAAAQPGTVVITEAIHRLVSGLFLVDQLGAQALKGIERPVQLYRVIQPSGVRGRLEAAAATLGLTPFVGREDELRLLMNRWERALEGEGQVVVVLGEAGIGKSRLLQCFHEQIVGTPHTWIEAGAGAFFQNTPFYPVIELLQHFLGGNGVQPAEERLEQLEPRLELAGLKPAETIPLIAPLLNLPLSGKYPPLPLSPEQQRRRLLATLVEWVLGAARVQPLIVATEDLHWADASTLELTQLLVEQGATARLLLLYTARPEFRAPWPPRAHHTQITLGRLSARNVRTMVEEVAARKAMSDETIATVIERTGGVPLFVEELTRAVLESGSAKLADREIPVTLHDSLMARLDRLGPAKEVIQIGAVIGGDFSYELLHAIHPIAEDSLQRALRNLTDAELLYVRGIAPDATYQFKHALIRDAAYEALLRSRRKQLHSRIAEVLVEQFPERVTSAPEHLAHHYTEANLIQEAIPYWQRAGQRAAQRSANVEAIAHFTKGLELLMTLPDTPERTEQELFLQTVLGAALMATKGFAAAEVERALSRARELCQRVGETPQLFPVLRGLAAFYLVRADYKTTEELGEQCLRLAQRLHDPLLLVGSHLERGATLFSLGEFAQALEHLEQGIALYDTEEHRFHAFLHGQDLGVSCLSRVTIVLWMLGYPDQALKRSREAIALAQEQSHPFSLAYALSFAAQCHGLRREGQAIQERAGAVLALASDQGFAIWAAGATILLGFGLVEQGQLEEGIVQIRQGLASWQATGAEMGRTEFLGLLAEAYGKAGQTEEGLTALAEALHLVQKTGERWYEAELYRLKGELLLAKEGRKGNIEEVEQCFLKAIAVARHQQAKSLELRAATSCARLWRQQGKQKDARAMLAEIYNWFTEGFDTADLKEAKALLDELSN